MARMNWNRPNGGYDTTGRYQPEPKKLRGFWSNTNASGAALSPGFKPAKPQRSPSNKIYLGVFIDPSTGQLVPAKPK